MARLPWEMAFAYDGTSTSPEFPNFWGARHVIERLLVPDAVRPAAPWPPTSEATSELRVGFALDYTVPYASGLLDGWQNTKGVSVDAIESADAFPQSCENEPSDIYIIYGRGVKSISGSAIAHWQRRFSQRQGYGRVENAEEDRMDARTCWYGVATIARSAFQ